MDREERIAKRIDYIIISLTITIIMLVAGPFVL